MKTTISSKHEVQAINFLTENDDNNKDEVNVLDTPSVKSRSIHQSERTLKTSCTNVPEDSNELLVMLDNELLLLDNNDSHENNDTDALSRLVLESKSVGELLVYKNYAYTTAVTKWAE